MKKLFYYLLVSMFLFTSCHDEQNELFKLQINQLEGEWVYDHPEENVWEVQKFMSSGIFYYSNKVTGNWKFHNSNNDGRYWIEEGNRVTCQYFINGVSTQLKMTVLEITPYEYTAECNDGAALGTFTYARLLSTIELKPEETKSPDYRSLVKSHIQKFRSHNAEIASVDDKGNITAKKKGHTYIDVITDQGTAVVEVIVFDRDNMFGDYSDAFGKTIPEVVEIYGDDYSYRDDTNGLAYYLDDYLADELLFITGAYDKSHVEFVQLVLNDNIAKTIIISYLNNKYQSLSQADGVYNYVTDLTVNNNPIAIIYNSNESTLSYLEIKPADRWTDFSYLFGQTDNVVNSEMKELGYPYLLSDYGYSKDGSDYYNITDSKDACMVGFVFNSEVKMCEYWVYLFDDYMNYANDILTWLKSKYNLSANESTNRQYIFYDKSNRMRIVFDASGYVSYTDSQQTPFTPASKSISALSKIKTIESASKPKYVSRYFNLKVPALIKN